MVNEDGFVNWEVAIHINESLVAYVLENSRQHHFLYNSLLLHTSIATLQVAQRKVGVGTAVFLVAVVKF